MTDNPGFEARKLARAARVASLATTADGGQPFASLVTHACAPDFSIFLLLSNLSEHTRHLRAEPRCALLVTAAAEGPNPQTTPRVTIIGLADQSDDPAMKRHFLAIHPYAALYADFDDFHLWRIRPMGALLVGGFARAMRVKQADLLPAIAASLVSREGVAAIDGDGMDRVMGETVQRVHWAEPITDAAGLAAEYAKHA